jgi:hypothetical protein
MKYNDKIWFSKKVSFYLDIKNYFVSFESSMKKFRKAKYHL